MKLLAVAGLVLLAIHIQYVSARNLWEQEDAEVLKELQSYEDDTAQTQEEAKDVTYHSTWLFNQYKTYFTHGMQNINGKETRWSSSFVSSQQTSYISTYTVKDGGSGGYTTTSYSTSFATGLIVPDYTTTSYSTSFATGLIVPDYTTTSYSTSFATGVVIPGFNVDWFTGTDAEWSNNVDFDVNKCGCESSDDLAAGQWVMKMLETWRKEIQGAQNEILNFFKTHKGIGVGWLNKAEDDRFGLFLQWARFISNLYRLHVNLGAKKFHENFDKTITGQLQALVNTLKVRYQERLREGRLAFEWLQHPEQYNGALDALANYKSLFADQYHRAWANLWRFHLNVKFGNKLAALYRKAEKYNAARDSVPDRWVVAFRRLLSLAYRRHSSLLSVWYKGVKERGYSWYLKHGKAALERSSNAFFKHIEAVYNTLTRKTNILLNNGRSAYNDAAFDSLFESLLAQIETDWKDIFSKASSDYDDLWKLRWNWDWDWSDHVPAPAPAPAPVKPHRHDSDDCGFFSAFMNGCKKSL